MSSKHFFDNSESLVSEALESLSLLDADLIFDKHQKAIIDATHDGSTHVSLISGGGAGHEPAHAAFVGAGLLTAVVSGNIFASPSVPQIVNTIRRAGGSAGVILIIKNYTGDVFHFLLAAQKVQAVYSLLVETVVVGDDVAVGRKLGGKVGRRGLAGTVLVHKILGAMAASGSCLQDVATMGRLVAQNLVTISTSLNHVHTPGRPVESHHVLRSDEIELGMGIHNEPGFKILSPQPSLDDLLDIMLGQLLDMRDTDRAFVDFKDAEEAVLLVNNLGGLSALEISAMTTRVVRKIVSRGVKLSRVLSGTYMTSLDSPGFSITLLKATHDMLMYLKAPATSTGWTVSAFAPKLSPKIFSSPECFHRREDSVIERSGNSLMTLNCPIFIAAVSNACISVIAAEPIITEYDSIVGDGDCGTTLRRGAETILAFLKSSRISNDALRTLLNLAEEVETSMDGTSGAIFGLFFNALAAAIRDLPNSTTEMKPDSWRLAAVSAMTTLKKATPARMGDRTLMDALDPFVMGLQTGSLSDAVLAAKKGMEKTRGMRPTFGRTVYVSEEMWKKVPDPGAVGIVAIVEGLMSRCCDKYASLRCSAVQATTPLIITLIRITLQLDRL